MFPSPNIRARFIASTSSISNNLCKTPRTAGGTGTQQLLVPFSRCLPNYTSTKFHYYHSTTRMTAFSSSPIDWWRDRQQAKEADKYKAKLVEMSNLESYTIRHMRDELQEAVDSWISKVPILSDNKETKVAKQMHATLSGLVKVLGEDADAQSLHNMTETQKLKAAIEGNTTLEDIDILTQQFQSMSIMHRVLRKRKLEGKKIPETPQAIQTIMQTEGQKVLTKSERQKLAKQAAKSMQQKMRRR